MEGAWDTAFPKTSPSGQLWCHTVNSHHLLLFPLCSDLPVLEMGLHEDLTLYRAEVHVWSCRNTAKSLQPRSEVILEKPQSK